MSELITCPYCNQEIDPDTCWCGDEIKHSPYAGHSPVPMGCSCGRITNTEMTRPDTYPAIVEADESPEGPGRDGNKPLMRNRRPDAASPVGILPDTLLT